MSSRTDIEVGPEGFVTAKIPDKGKGGRATLGMRVFKEGVQWNSLFPEKVISVCRAVIQAMSRLHTDLDI